MQKNWNLMAALVLCICKHPLRNKIKYVVFSITHIYTYAGLAVIILNIDSSSYKLVVKGEIKKFFFEI